MMPAKEPMREITHKNVRDMLFDPNGNMLPNLTIDTLEDFCKLTELIRRCWSEKAKERKEQGLMKSFAGEILPWFRGVNNSRHTLTPKLARAWKDLSANEGTKGFSIYDLEDYYYDRFTRFGRPFLEGAFPQDEIEWNYIMRHHEIPSRLLDWTKGSLIALSYATKGCLERQIDQIMNNSSTEQTVNHRSKELCKKEPTNSAVWMLEPRRLMEQATSCLFQDGNIKGIRNIASRNILVKSMRRDFFRSRDKYGNSNSLRDPEDIVFGCKELTNYNHDLKFCDHENYWKYPIPLIPSHIAKRVESHLSRFTLHSLSGYWPTQNDSQEVPDQDVGMYRFAEDSFSIDDIWYLVKIEIDARRLSDIGRDLRMTGVGDMNFTRDLDGLSRELQIRAKLGCYDDQVK
jgi:hypothetical protein